MVGNTPHNPVRFADTVGIVIERVRPDDAIGALLFTYLQNISDLICWVFDDLQIVYDGTARTHRTLRRRSFAKIRSM